MFTLKYIKYYTFWVLFFVAARVLFLAYHQDKSAEIGWETCLETQYYGFQLDFSAAGYFSVIPFFIFFLAGFFHNKRVFIRILRVYSWLFLLVSSGLVAADLELYNNWGFRLDDTFLKYLMSPKEMTATVSSYPIATLVGLFLLIVGILGFILEKIVLKNLYTEGGASVSWQKQTLWGILRLALVGTLIVPIRGGFQLAPVNQSAVYFSNDPYTNHAAVNCIWNFFVSTFEKTSKNDNPYRYFSDTDVAKWLKPYQRDSSDTEYLINKKIKNPNVIIITYESLTAKLIERLGGVKGVTPEFHKLCKEGVLFTNVYAAGDRTDRGLVAVLSGYPSIPRANILEVPRKSAQIPILSRSFRAKNYTTGFYYGGEAEFANMKSYLLNGQFQQLVTIENFDKADLNSKWGAFDHVVFDRLLKDLRTWQSPFFVNLLTLSSHEPFEVPAGAEWTVPYLPEGGDIDAQFKRVHFYSDKALGRFIEAAKKETWWDSTLVVIVADHSSQHIEPKDNWFKRFHIPMLWLGGVLKEKNKIIHKITSQCDIAATVLGQLDLPHGDYTFSKNIMQTNIRPYAYFAFQNGFGFVQNQKKFVFDINGKIIMQKQGDINEAFLNAGKSYLQKTYQDYLVK